MRKNLLPKMKLSVSRIIFPALLLMMTSTIASAQLSTNPDKFLGNITTMGNVDYGKEKFYTLWNQITCENESKWSSIQGGGRGSFNWGGSDNAYNYAKQHGFPFKWHTLVWGSQYPGWMDNLSTDEQYKAIVEWMDAIQKRYPDLAIIDVVNEAVPGHAPAPYKEALGGDGVTGYDWIIKAFEMAYERWPDAILVYNDYNSFQWNRSQFITLVKTIRDAGAPVDAYGCQSHDLTDCDISTFRTAMNELQTNLKMPMYSTEYDIGTGNDNLQLQRYKEQIPLMWESDYCAGITLWGYIYGHTWTTDGNSGIIKDDGSYRPAMDWLREYMASDAAKNAKSPFPGMKKEASVYVKPAAPKIALNDSVPITVRARLRTKKIEKVELYVKNQLYATMTEEPYVAYYKPITTSTHALRAVVYADDGSTYERLGSFTVGKRRTIFNENMEIPGIIEGEDFDAGDDGIAYHDTDTRNTGDAKTYRTNGGGVDINKAGEGFALGKTAAGEWVEYTVDVKEEGMYAFEAEASAGAYDASFKLALSNYMEQTPLTDNILVPCPELGNYNNYRTIYGRLLVPLKTGKQIIRLNVTGGECNIDRIRFMRVDINEDVKARVSASPVSFTLGDKTTVKATITDNGHEIKEVRLYANGAWFATLTETPYQIDFYPETKGNCLIGVIAVDAEGKESNMGTFRITVKNRQSVYGEMAELPGIVEAENFDQGGEGISFHDSDEKDEGAVKYRLDNEGVDIVSGNGGRALGYTANGEWTEYTVNVSETAKYEFEATVSAGVTGSSFRINWVRGGSILSLANVTVPQTASNSWDTYRVVKGTINRNLEAGEQTLRITITGPQCNIDKIKFILPESVGIDAVLESMPWNQQPAIYNLNGQRLNSLQKGINIVNGKKVFVK